EKHEADAEHPCKTRNYTDDLGNELARVAIEEPGHAARNRVPGATVVTSTVGKEPRSQRAPDATNTVNGDRPHRVIYLSNVIEEPDCPADQNAGDEADNECINRTDKTSRCGDSYKAGEDCIYGHTRAWFAIPPPHVQHPRERCRRSRKHSVYSHHTNT